MLQVPNLGVYPFTVRWLLYKPLSNVCTSLRFTHRVYICVLYDLTTNSTSGPDEQKGLSPTLSFLRKCTVFPRISSSFTH